MSQLFQRKPIADLVVDEADASRSLKRVLGAGDLIMLAIGAVIGAGIFGAIGTAAAGQVAPDGTVIRYAAGPALIFSFILLGGACALAALCYAELAAMIPQAGSAYAYSYATLGELVAWIIGWDLMLDTRSATSPSRFRGATISTRSCAASASSLPAWLTTGYRTALLSSNPDVSDLLNTAPNVLGIPILVNLPAFAIVMLITWLLLRGARESASANTIMVVIKLRGARALHRRRRDEHQPRQLHAVRAQRIHRHPSGRGDRVLRLHRLRRDLDRGGGNARTRSATCRSASSAAWRSARSSTWSSASSSPGWCRTPSSASPIRWRARSS